MIKEARIVSIISLFPMPQYVVVLEDLEKTHLVPIWIGVNEGNAISLELQGEKFPRPLTHDLIVSVLGKTHASVEKIVISELKDNSYFALIYLIHNEKKIKIDARPSDSLAIAVRVHCPIFIDERVLKMCPVVSHPITENEIDKFKKQLKTMTPEDFFKNLENAVASTEPSADSTLNNLDSESDNNLNDNEDQEEDDEKGST